MSIYENISGSEFHDVLPEISSVPSQRGKNSTDPTLLPEIEQAILDGVHTDIAISYAHFIRTKQRGSEVRESIARFGLWLDVRTNGAEAISTQVASQGLALMKEVASMREEFNQAISAATVDSEVKLARMSSHKNKTYATLKERLDDADGIIYPEYAREVATSTLLQDDLFGQYTPYSTLTKIDDSISYDMLPIIRAHVDDPKQDVYKFVPKII